MTYSPISRSNTMAMYRFLLLFDGKHSCGNPGRMAGRALMLLALLLFTALAVASDPVRIVVISDINGRYGSTEYHPRVAAAISQIIDLKPRLVISTGDMVAGQRARPRLMRTDLDAPWQSFHRQVRAPLERAGIPLVMTPGNHDASAYPGFEHERAAYADYHRAHPPALAPRPEGNFPYHFALEHGDLLLLSVDATRIGPLDADQRDWLATQLQWPGPKIVFGHLPLQPVARGREREVITDPALEALLAEHDVSAYLSGHHHAWYPGHRGGVTMLSVGNLGGNQRALTGTDHLTGFTFAVLELDAAGDLQARALVAPDFAVEVDILQLPRAIGRGEHRLVRRDLAREPEPSETAGSLP